MWINKFFKRNKTTNSSSKKSAYNIYDTNVLGIKLIETQDGSYYSFKNGSKSELYKTASIGFFNGYAGIERFDGTYGYISISGNELKYIDNTIYKSYYSVNNFTNENLTSSYCRANEYICLDKYNGSLLIYRNRYTFNSIKRCENIIFASPIMENKHIMFEIGDLYTNVILDCIESFRIKSEEGYILVIRRERYYIYSIKLRKFVISNYKIKPEYLGNETFLLKMDNMNALYRIGENENNIKWYDNLEANNNGLIIAGSNILNLYDDSFKLHVNKYKLLCNDNVLITFSDDSDFITAIYTFYNKTVKCFYPKENYIYKQSNNYNILSLLDCNINPIVTNALNDPFKRTNEVYYKSIKLINSEKYCGVAIDSFNQNVLLNKDGSSEMLKISEEWDICNEYLKYKCDDAYKILLIK